MLGSAIPNSEGDNQMFSLSSMMYRMEADTFLHLSSKKFKDMTFDWFSVISKQSEQSHVPQKVEFITSAIAEHALFLNHSLLSKAKNINPS